MAQVRKQFSDHFFYTIATILLSIFLILVLYPCIFVVSASFSSGTAVQSGKVILFPVDFSTEGYKIVFNTPTIWLGFMNSIFYTVCATLLNVTLTITAAYCLSRKDLPGHNLLMFIFTFTMFFNGGIITNYLLIQKLDMLDTRWSMIVPGAINVYNLIIARTFIKENIPNELLESAQLDGCSDMTFFVKIVLPLSKAILAVLVLFYGVGHWNAYFNAMIYLNTKSLYPLTLFLREILLSSQIDPSSVADPELQAIIADTAAVIKYALIVISMIPILIIYPFVQKYFVKGVMIGSIKG